MICKEHTYILTITNLPIITNTDLSKLLKKAILINTNGRNKKKRISGGADNECKMYPRNST